MGMNFASCCHKCQVKIIHDRGEEGLTLSAFYRKHYQCMRSNPNNLETLEDQVQGRGWMYGDGYPSDDLGATEKTSPNHAAPIPIEDCTLERF